MTILVDASSKSETVRDTRDLRQTTTTTEGATNNTEALSHSSLCDIPIDSQYNDRIASSTAKAIAVETFFDLDSLQLQLPMVERKRRQHDWSADLKKARAAADARKNTNDSAESTETKKVRFDNVVVREHSLTLGGHVYRRADGSHPPLEQLMFGLALGWEVVSETEYSITDFEKRRRVCRRRIKNSRDRFDMLVRAGLDPVELCARESQRLDTSADKVMRLFMKFPPVVVDVWSHQETYVVSGDHVTEVAPQIVHGKTLYDNFDYCDIPDDYDVCFD